MGLARPPSLRYLSEQNDAASRTLESQWHKIYIGWLAVLGQLTLAVDTDNDGKADQAINYADGPATVFIDIINLPMARRTSSRSASMWLTMSTASTRAASETLSEASTGKSLASR
jgi:hypothetical protein